MHRRPDISCTRCGACLSVCPVYDITRHELFSPRGKIRLLSGSHHCDMPQDLHPHLKDSKILETLDLCLQCGACSSICPAGVAVDDIIRSVRRNVRYLGGWGEMVLKGALNRPGPMFYLAKLFSRFPFRLPVESGLLLRFSGLIDTLSSKKTCISLPTISSKPFLSRGLDGIKDKGRGSTREKRIIFFLGCVQNYIYPEIAEAITHCLGGKLIIPPHQRCCGMPAFASGLTEQARALAVLNIRAIKEAGDFDIIVTGCASCAAMIRRWHRLFENGPVKDTALLIASKTKEFSEFVMESGLAIGISERYQGLTMAYHAPCHKRYMLNQQARIYATERLLAYLNPGYFRPIPNGCCGHGGMFSLRHTDLSSAIFEKRLKIIEENEVNVVVTTCSGCLLQFRTNLPENNLKVVHLAEILMTKTSL